MKIYVNENPVIRFASACLLTLFLSCFVTPSASAALQTQGKKKAAPKKKTEQAVTETAPSVPGPNSLISSHVMGVIEARKLNMQQWDKAKALMIPLAPQIVTTPKLEHQTVDSIRVRSLYNGSSIAFLIEWNDSTRNVIVDVDKFCDQLAVQLPLDADNVPSFMMGHVQNKVHIVHWKGVWQEDCERGFRNVKDAYPNYWADVYPMQLNGTNGSNQVYAKDIPAEQMIASDSRSFMAGTYSENPMSQIRRTQPVEEAVAEGFGTLATQDIQNATGWGEWNNNRWRVCIVVPVNSGSRNKASIKDKSMIAFALWNGSDNNVGGRKHYAQWTELFIEK